MENLVPVSVWRAGFEPFWLEVALEDPKKIPHTTSQETSALWALWCLRS